MKILKDGKLVTVPSLKSDTKKSHVVAKVEEAVDPDEIDPSALGEATESIHAEKTVAELKSFLDEHEVEYPSNAKKAQLIELADEVEVDESTEV